MRDEVRTSSETRGFEDMRSNRASRVKEREINRREMNRDENRGKAVEEGQLSTRKHKNERKQEELASVCIHDEDHQRSCEWPILRLVKSRRTSGSCSWRHQVRTCYQKKRLRDFEVSSVRDGGQG